MILIWLSITGQSEEPDDSMNSPDDVDPVPNLTHSDEQHEKSLLTSFCALQKNRQFCDARLVVSAHEIHIHRALLASVSSYLFDIFSRKESDPCVYETYKLKDVDYDSFQHVLNYAYTGRWEHFLSIAQIYYYTSSNRAWVGILVQLLVFLFVFWEMQIFLDQVVHLFCKFISRAALAVFCTFSFLVFSWQLVPWFS